MHLIYVYETDFFSPQKQAWPVLLQGDDLIGIAQVSQNMLF